jgi:hypothetical protein
MNRWLSIENRSDDIITLSGSYFSSLNQPTSSMLANAHDSDYSSYFQHYSSNCYVGLTLPPDVVARPYRMLFYPAMTYATKIKRFAFEGMIAGTKTYVPLAISTGGKEGWNYITAVNGTTQWYSAFRYRALESSTSSQCLLAEVEFSGIIAYNRSSCPIVAHFPAVKTTVSLGIVQFSYSATPEIYDMNPRNGSSLGGEIVTLTGRNLAPITTTTTNDLGVQIKLNGISCDVLTVTNVSITCKTGYRDPDNIYSLSISVIAEGKGIAYIPGDLEYLYIDKWSSLNTWKNQEPPIDGDVVWIPQGQQILLDMSTPLLYFFLVEGELYFDANQPLITVDTHYWLILGGYVEIGTHERPYESNVVITIHGERYSSIEMPMIGNKFIAVMNTDAPKYEFIPGRHIPGPDVGHLEIHGKPRQRTWTYIDSTIHVGQMYFLTTEPVDFAPGDRLIITSTEIPTDTSPSGYGFEEVIVAENIDGYNISVTLPFEYIHRSEIHSVSELENRTFHMRCSVGLLSRNIIIQGDDVYSAKQLFGVHTIAFMSGIYRFENAEIRHCGQAFSFGRYCT